MPSSLFRQLLLAALTMATVAGFAKAQAKNGPHFYEGVKVICIGIDDYFSPGVPKLSQAVADATAFAGVVEKQFGFVSPKLLLNKNATKKAIFEALDDFDASKEPPEVLIVYFACHGTSFEYREKSNPVPIRVGFLVPHDAQLDLKDTSRPGLWAEEAIGMRALVDRLERLKCRHVLLIADTCCSGFLTKRGGLESRETISLLSDPSRTVLAATTQQEAALEGIFTRELVKILEQSAKDNEPLSVSDVFQKLRYVVPQKAGIKMTPQMSHVGAGDGEFVFIPKSVAAGEVAKLKEAVEDVKKGIRVDNAKLVAFRGLLERKQKLIGRQSSLSDVVLAMEAPNYRFSADAEAEAQRWQGIRRGFHENAAFGDVWAMAGLHFCYAKGLGTEPSPKEAYYWAQQADQCQKPAGVGRFLLGRCYESGIGIQKNPTSAKKLYTESSDQGFVLGQWVTGAAILRSNPNDDDLRRARGLLEQASKSGVASAATELGAMYCGLTSVPGARQDLDKGLALLEEAGKKGDAQAQFLLGNLYSRGQENLKPDKKIGLKWLRQAADKAHPLAQAHLARAYCYDPKDKQSLGLVRDYQRALELAEMAAKQGSPEGNLLLAQLYKEGLGGKINQDQARKHLEQAADSTLPEAIWLQAFWIMRRECGYTLDATKSVDVYRHAVAIDPRLTFLDTPFYLEPRPVAFPPETIEKLRTAPRQAHVQILLQAVIADLIGRVGKRP